jgi:hypothetical protein
VSERGCVVIISCLEGVSCKADVGLVWMTFCGDYCLVDNIFSEAFIVNRAYIVPV